LPVPEKKSTSTIVALSSFCLFTIIVLFSSIIASFSFRLFDWCHAAGYEWISSGSATEIHTDKVTDFSTPKSGDGFRTDEVTDFSNLVDP
jgi:hypothetical protein